MNVKRKFSELSSLTDDLEINMSKKCTKEETVKTFCRMRQSEKMTDAYKIFNDNTKLTIDDKNSNIKSFIFTKIFAPISDQNEIFQTICIPLIDDMINLQKSGLIFTFGLTNSGKTYTIVGDTSNPGILPLTMKYVFDIVNTQNINIYCNYIEIYNEDVYDLLSENGKKKLTIKERDKVFYVNSNSSLF
jgi:hypothetical protein